MLIREMYRYLVQNTVFLAALLFSGNFIYADKCIDTFLGYLIMTAFSFQHLDIFRPDRSGSRADMLDYAVHFALGTTLLVASFSLNNYFGLLCVLYLVIRYTHLVWLKSIAIVNVAMLPAEMALKGAAGAVLIDVFMGGWGVNCLFLLGLLVSLGKTKNAAKFKNNRTHFGPVYSPKLLNEMMAVVSSSAVVAYCMYTISPNTVLNIGTEKLIYTVPFVLYGIFRYIWLINQVDLQAEIELYLFKDRAMGVNLLGWIGSIMIILLFFRS